MKKNQEIIYPENQRIIDRMEEETGDVLQSALNGDTACQFVIYLPEDIMEKFVHITK